MKKYNIQNYVRYKKEIDKLSRKLETKDWSECDREELRYFNYDSNDEVIDENIDKVYELLDEIYFKSIEKKSTYLVKKDELKHSKLIQNKQPLKV